MTFLYPAYILALMGFIVLYRPARIRLLLLAVKITLITLTGLLAITGWLTACLTRLARILAVLAGM